MLRQTQQKSKPNQNHRVIGIVALLLIIASLSCSLPGVEDRTDADSYTDFPTPIKPTVAETVTVNVVRSSTAVKEPNGVEMTDADSVIVVTQAGINTQAGVNTQTVILNTPTGFDYVVQNGDSLYKIARRFCGDARKYIWLARVNRLELRHVLYIGQTLRINCGEDQ